MAAVKGRENKLTEVRLIDLFRRNTMTGWRRHLPLRGKPDFTFARQRVVIFVDGCFWHGCARHLRLPQSNQAYWEKNCAVS
jgi:DNA mismatch endonuclease (patch repair protein)